MPRGGQPQTPLRSLSRRRIGFPLDLLLFLGAGLFLVSNIITMVRQSRVSEDAAHTPIIVAIGLWLLVDGWRKRTAPAEGGIASIALLILVPMLAINIVASWFEWGTIAGYSAWASLVACGYAILGARALAGMWFPIVYLLFAVPLPGGTTVVLTQGLRLALSDHAVTILDLFGYPVAREGVSIFVGHYQLLVEQACSGLNSMISLTAIGLFYAYARYGASWRYSLIFAAAVVPVAILANLCRIIILVLITYHFGDAVAQGFIHDAAGLILFSIAFAGMFGVDRLLAPVRRALGIAA